MTFTTVHSSKNLVQFFAWFIIQKFAPYSFFQSFPSFCLENPVFYMIVPRRSSFFASCFSFLRFLMSRIVNIAGNCIYEAIWGMAVLFYYGGFYGGFRLRWKSLMSLATPSLHLNVVLILLFELEKETIIRLCNVSNTIEVN